MVWLREIDFQPDPRDTTFERSARDFINNMKPFRASSVDFKAYVPPPPNPIDAYAPMALLLLLGAFLVMK